MNEAIPLLAKGVGAKWWTSAVRMVTGGQATRYLLLHLTNSDDGRDLIKDCSWRIFPDGQFVARKSDRPDQKFLLELEPDLAPLRKWVLAHAPTEPSKAGTHSWHGVWIVIPAGQIDRLPFLEAELRRLLGEGWGVDPLRGLLVPYVAA